MVASGRDGADSYEAPASEKAQGSRQKPGRELRGVLWRGPEHIATWLAQTQSDGPSLLFWFLSNRVYCDCVPLRPRTPSYTTTLNLYPLYPASTTDESLEVQAACQWPADCDRCLRWTPRILSLPVFQPLLEAMCKPCQNSLSSSTVGPRFPP